MALKQELQEILDNSKYSDAAHKQALAELLEKDEEFAADFQSGYMKEKDYRQKTQAVAEAKKQLEKQQQEFTEGRDYLDGQMNTYKSDMEKRLNDQIAQAAKSRVYGAALESKLTALAAQYGEDPEALLADVKEMRTKEPEAKKDTFDEEEFNKRYVSTKKFDETANAVFGFAPQIRDFEREYARTFGKEYDGSITELVNEASREVSARRARGQNIDLFGYMKEKLDFTGQAQRNTEASKLAAEKEKEDWQKQTREEIERDVRSKVLAENPNAFKSFEVKKAEAWRNNLGSQARQNKLPERTAQTDFARRQEIQQKFLDNAAKAGVAI